MAQKVKKQFFKILPWSVAMLMIFALAAGIWQGLPADEVKAADDSITLNSTQLTLSNDADANNYANIGDTVTVVVDLSNSDGGCAAAGTTVTADMTAYGGTTTETLACTTDNGGTNDIFTLNFIVVDAGGSGIDVGANNAASAVTATASDSDEQTGTGNPNPTQTSNNLGDGTIDTAASNGVDTIAPVVTDANISIAGGTGTGGAYIVGDTITVTWDAATDGTTDLGSATADLSGWGGGTAVAMSDTTACTGTSGDNVWEACYTLVAGSIDATNVNATVTATDDAGNTTGPVSDTTNATVDNQLPVVTDANISIAGGTGTGGAYIVGDTITVTWDAATDGTTDLGSATADLSGWGGGTAVAMSDTTACTGTSGDNVWEACYTLVAGSIDATNVNATVTATDDAGNTTGPVSDTTNATVDNQLPTIISATTADNDSNGQIDTLVVVYNEAVNDPNYDAVAITGYPLLGTGTGSGTTTLDYDITESGTPDTGATPALTWTAANAADLAGNDLDTTGAPANATDGAMPILLSFTSTTADGTYGPGYGINITATYSENISSGSVTVNLNNGVTGVTLSTIATNTISGTYTVGSTGSGEDITGLDVSAISSQSASDGTNTNSSTTMPSTTITTASSINVDTTAPVITNLSVSPSSGTSIVGETVTLNITADAAGYIANNITLNGVNITASNFQDLGGGAYSADYMISEGNSDVAAGLISASVVLSDVVDGGSANLNTPYTTMSANTLQIDANSPTIISATTADNDSNGQIDTVVVVYSENVNDSDYNAFTLTGYTLPYSGTGSGSTTLNYDINESGSGDTDATPAISWLTSNATDVAGNTLNSTGAPANPTDGAAPVIVTTSPASGATFVSTSANIVVTFSEPMNIGTVTQTSSPDPGGWGVTWDGTNEVATYTHSVFAPLTNYTQTITAGTGADGLALAGGPVPNPWSFQTMSYSSGGGGGGGSTTAPTCSLKINNNAISTDNLDVTLTVSVTGDVSQLLLSNNSNFTAAAWQAYNSTVDWTLDGTETDYGTKIVYAKVKSSSGQMSITCSDEIDYVEPGMADETPAEETEEPTTPPAEETDLVTQDPEPAGPLPSGVSVGTLVKRPDMSTVYFIDQDNRRHAFPDLNTYYSWFSDFSGVQTISSELMSQIPLGSNVVIRPGTYLIKIQSLPHTYAVEPYGVIRWIENQQVAADLYGSDWNQKIVDVDPSFFVNYQVGSAIDTASHPTGSVIQYEGDTSRYYIQDEVKQLILGSVFSNNKLQSKFVIDNVPESMSYESGANMSMLNLETLMTLR